MSRMENLAAERLHLVRERMASACARASRSPHEVTLLAVTKTRTESELREVYGLGLRAFGENRVPEAVEKQTRLPNDIEWHMIGHLQSNKAKDCGRFHWLHSLDKAETAAAVNKVFALERRLNVLLEVNGGEDAKHGVRDLDALRRLADAVVGMPHLRLRGLMTMAPFSPDERVVRPCFVKVRQWAETMQSEHPEQDWSTLSMGMTNDLEWAIEEGSTLVRIGTALFEGFR